MNKKQIISVVSIILIVALMATVLVACNQESVTKKLQDKEYRVGTIDRVVSLIGIDVEQVEWSLLALKQDNLVAVVKYNKTEDAKALEEKIGGEITLMGVKCGIKRSMKTIYIGTEQGIKDAK